MRCLLRDEVQVAEVGRWRVHDHVDQTHHVVMPCTPVLSPTAVIPQPAWYPASKTHAEGAIAQSPRPARLHVCAYGYACACAVL